MGWGWGVRKPARADQIWHTEYPQTIFSLWIRTQSRPGHYQLPKCSPTALQTSLKSYLWAVKTLRCTLSSCSNKQQAYVSIAAYRWLIIRDLAALIVTQDKVFRLIWPSSPTCCSKTNVRWWIPLAGRVLKCPCMAPGDKVHKCNFLLRSLSRGALHERHDTL
jgi:hypothetical protein